MKNDAKLHANFVKNFFTKSEKLEKGNLNVFAHISGLRLDTRIYCTSFESYKPKDCSIFYAFFAKNHHESHYGPKHLYHFFRDSLYLRTLCIFLGH